MVKWITRLCFTTGKRTANETRVVLTEVYEALKEKHNPISQLVGYIMSGDPTYITNHKNARALVTRVERM